MSNSVLVEEASGLLVEVVDSATSIEGLTPPIEQIVSVEQGAIVDQAASYEVIADDTTATVIETLYVLPTSTPPEEEPVYAERVDFVTESLIYRGEAAVGTLESQAGWRIRRLTLASDDDVTTEWANGNANFTNVWDNRASLSYS